MKHKQLSPIIGTILYIILSVIPVVLAIFIYPDYVLKEAYIHIGYIEGLLNGEGFTFRGQVSYGSASPLWIVMGAFTAILLEDPLFSLKLLSGIFSFLSVFFFLKLLDVLKIRSTLKFIAALSFSLNPFFLKWAISGTEASAAAAVLLFLIFAYSDRYHVRHPYIYGLMLGFASLIRPEFIIFAIIFFLHLLLINKHHKKKAAISFLMFLLISVGWMIYAQISFGSAVSQYYTIYLQENFSPSGSFTLFKNIYLMLGSNIPEFLLLIVSTVVISILLLKRTQYFTEEYIRLMERLRYNGILIGLIFLIAIYIYYSLKGLVVSQVILMFIPLIILLLASLINLLTNFRSIFNISLITVYTVLMLIIHTHITYAVLKPAADVYIKGFHNSYKEIANFIRTDENDRYKTAAAAEAGIIGYYSGVQVYDLTGLTSSERKDYSSEYDYIFAKKPGYLVLKNNEELKNFIPEEITNELLYTREIPDLNPESNNTLKLTLYKIEWDEQSDQDQIYLPDLMP